MENVKFIFGKLLALVFVWFLIASILSGVLPLVVQADTAPIYEADDGPRAHFSVYNKASAKSNNDTLTSGMHLVQYRYGLSVLNFNDTSDTVLGNIECTLEGDNIINVEDEEYANWNDSYVNWVFPSDYFIVEDDWLWTEAKTSFFETKYIPMTMSRSVNESIFDADGYQLAEFNITFEDIDNYGGMVGGFEDSLVNASLVADTFFTDAPLYPNSTILKNEHEIHFNIDRSYLQANKTPCVLAPAPHHSLCVSQTNLGRWPSHSLCGVSLALLLSAPSGLPPN